MQASILVVGFGSDLQGDDAAGLETVRRLGALGPVPGMRTDEGGTDALRIASLWAGEPEVWLVDALRAGASPGTVHRLGHGELMALPQRTHGAHEMSLPESVRWLVLAFPALATVRWRLWGIEPGCLGLQRGLSLAVAWATEHVAAEIHHLAGGAAAARIEAIPPGGKA